MKVLWFSNTPANGADVLNLIENSGGWLSSLDRAISKHVELSVSFYYARFAKPFEHKGVLYYPICNKNWRLNIIKNRILNTFVDKDDLPLFFEIIRKVHPDIIHIHGTENPFGSLISITNIPLVLSIQGNCTVCEHKYYSGIERKFGSKKVIDILDPFTWIFSESFNHKHRKLVRKKLREIRNLKYCKNIVGRTDWDRRITRILSPQSTYFHNDEILRDSFYKKKWVKTGNKNTIVHTTSGESYFKGFETICYTLHELNKIGINIEWRVAGVSQGGLLDMAVKKKLKSLYPTHGLILLGNLQEQELQERMLEADIYVMPSHIENSPNNLCEAMILGLPIITTLAGGTSSLLKDKEEGIIIQDGDPWSMAGAILELQQNPEMAYRYGQNARKRALARHDPDKIIKELLSIYNMILQDYRSI